MDIVSEGRPLRRPRSPIEIGCTFGRWTVTGSATLLSAGSSRERTYYPCRCECGTEQLVMGQNLANGRSVSCGCFKSERLSIAQTKHGQCDTRLYGIWQGMISRCEYPTTNKYERYGGRGIKVCPEWHDFIAFYNWALAAGYADDLQIDRKDNDGNYESDNCHWVTRLHQTNNHPANHMLTAFGETKSLSDWARDERCAVEYGTLSGRVREGRQNPEIMITTPKIEHKCHPRQRVHNQV